MTTRSHPAISPHPSRERWRRTLRLPLGTSPVQLGFWFCAPSSQPQGAPRPPAPLPPPSEHRSLSLSPPLPAPGIRALSSGAEAPAASRRARPGNSAARTAALRPLGWVRDEDGPVRPAHWRGRRRADGPAWQPGDRGGGGALPARGRGRPWRAGGRRSAQRRGPRAVGESEGAALAVPAGRPGSRSPQPRLLRGREPGGPAQRSSSRIWPWNGRSEDGSLGILSRIGHPNTLPFFYPKVGVGRKKRKRKTETKAEIQRWSDFPKVTDLYLPLTNVYSFI